MPSLHVRGKLVYYSSKRPVTNNGTKTRGKGLRRLESSTLPLVRCHSPAWPQERARCAGVQDFDSSGRGPTVPSLPENNGSLAKNGARASIARGRCVCSVPAFSGFLWQNGLPRVSVPLFVTGLNNVGCGTHADII